MPIGFPIFVIGVAAGVALGRRALLVPVVVEFVWWLAVGVGDGFTNHSGSGDNLGAVGLLAALVGTVIGIVGVAVGIGTRALLRRYRRPADEGSDGS